MPSLAMDGEKRAFVRGGTASVMADIESGPRFDFPLRCLIRINSFLSSSA